MKDRGEATRLAAARLFIMAFTVCIGLAIIASILTVIVSTMAGFYYYPKGLYNTAICIVMFVSGPLTLRWIHVSLQRSLVFYCLFNVALVGTMFALGSKLGIRQDLFPALYIPHIGILVVALVAGKRSALVTAAGGVVYLMFVGQFLSDWQSLGIPIIMALVLPFTAVLVEQLLDEVEKEARRARLAESSIDIMAHDMGNPLAVLSASLEMLEEPELALEQRETLMRAIRRNSRTLRNLLDEFRDISRLDMAVPMEKVNLQSIAHDVVELYARPMCAKRGQKLQAGLQPVEIIGAPSRLSRVMRELLTNAMKYTPRGGLIEVTLYAADQAILRVSDNGWGIKEEELARVFEQHWRGSNAPQENAGGRGLGLFICKSIVESHGGYIEVESQENKGSTFTIYLPLPETAADLSPAEAGRDQKKIPQPQQNILPLSGL